ncbi:pseudouridine synthase [Fructilactobacillus vespulae]|uniref:pseudouridine synthase n=1 Tax=Fructilactobacillus vespulae TaxID=1249630 RepID=UPI0039B36BFC
MSERLQKVMAHAGVASRRACEKLIEAGHVRVNGSVVTNLGTKVDETDRIEVDHTLINQEEPVYFILNKPKGVITSVEDEKKRKTVLDFFKHKVNERIYPVGRLDYDTSGALLLTNDGKLDYLLTHPKFEIDKTYVAKVEGIPSESELDKLRKGIRLEKNVKSAPADVKLLKKVGENEQDGLIELTIHEGKNHEVKKMLQAINHPVHKLKRISFANLNVDGLEVGKWRPLRKREIRDLFELQNQENGKNN